MALPRFILPRADVGSGIKPPSGAQLFFYEPGTSQDKDTFTDTEGTIPSANPVIADSTGLFASIYLSGSYKVVLRSKPTPPATEGSQIWEEDNVSGPLSAGFEEYADQSYDKHSTLSEATSDPLAAVGVSVRIEDRDDGVFDWVIGETANGYNIVEHDTLPLQLKLRVKGNSINASNFGNFGTGDDGGIVAAAIALALPLSFDVVVPKQDATLSFAENFKVTAPISIDMSGNEFTYTDLASAVKYSAVFEFAGSVDVGTQAELASDFERYSTRLTMTSNPFVVGDYVAAMYNTTTVGDEYGLFEKILFLAKVIGIDGNDVTIDYDAKFDLLVDGTGYEAPITGTFKLVKANPIINPSVKNATFLTPSVGARIALTTFSVCVNGAGDNLIADEIESHLCYMNACRNTWINNSATNNPTVVSGGQGYTTQSFGCKGCGMRNTVGHKVRHHWDSSFFTVDSTCRDCESYDSQGNFDYGCHSQYVSGLLLDNCQAHGDIQSGANETGVQWGNDDATFGGVTDRLRVLGGSYTGRSARVYAFPVNFEDCSVSFIDFKFAQTSNLINFQVRTHSNSKVTFTNPDIDGFKISFGSGTYTENVTFHGGKIVLDSQGWAGSGSASVEFFGTNVKGVPTSGIRGFKMNGGFLDMGTQQNPVCEVFVLDGTVITGDITWLGVDSNSKLMFDDVRWTKSLGALRLRNNAEIKGLKYTALSNSPTIFVESAFLDAAAVNMSGLERFSVDGSVGVGGIYQLHNNVRLLTVSGYDLTLIDRVQMISTNVASGYTGNNTPGTKSVYTDNLSYA